MNLPNIAGLVKVVKTFALANRPEILLGASLTATVGTGILAAIGGYKARGIIDDAEADRVDQSIPLTVQEKVKLTWLCYLPAVAAGTTAVGSTAGLHLVHVKDKKQLVAAGAAALEELKTEFKEYEKKNTVGVMSNEEKQKILEARAEKTPIEGERKSSHVQNSDDFIEEMYLVRDGKTGRDIWSNQHRIEDAVIEANNVLNSGSPVELNWFYNYAGYNRVKDGDDIGWSGQLISLDWEETVRDDGRPVREFHISPKPEKGFSSAHQ